MDQSTVSLIVGITGSLVTIAGWVVLNQLGRRKDREARLESDRRADKIKRLEISLKQVEAQIGEFYGPMDGLIHQVWATWEVKERIKRAIPPDTQSKVDHFVGERYFMPMHLQLRQLIMEKVHLIEGATIPQSFYDYMKHSMMENIQITLWNEQQISTLAAEGISWPQQFALDVERGLQVSMHRYEGLLAELRSDPAAEPGFAVAMGVEATRRYEQGSM